MTLRIRNASPLPSLLGALLAALVVSSCTSGRVEPTEPSVGSTSAAPVTAPSGLPPTDAVTGLRAIQQQIGGCLERPDTCRIDSVAVPGSPAYVALDSLRNYYLMNDLVAHLVPGVTYVVPERVHRVDARRAEIILCEVDGSWQMDSRRTTRTDDDIVWNDLIVSRRARHVIVADGQRWRRERVDELEFWPGENRCPAGSPSSVPVSSGSASSGSTS